MLAFDCQRCEVQVPTELCANCKRWAAHPQQTWGPRTPYTSRETSGDHCDYTPIKELPDDSGTA